MVQRLFHSSSVYIEGKIKPAPKILVQGGAVGDYVFAQPDELAAHAYALKNDENIATGVRDWVYTIGRGRHAFLNNLPRDQAGRVGGYIYEVSPDHFVETSAGSPEWVSDSLSGDLTYGGP